VALRKEAIEISNFGALLRRQTFYTRIGRDWHERLRIHRHALHRAPCGHGTIDGFEQWAVGRGCLHQRPLRQARIREDRRNPGSIAKGADNLYLWMLDDQKESRWAISWPTRGDKARRIAHRWQQIGERKAVPDAVLLQQQP